jgi:hypothetical protein
MLFNSTYSGNILISKWSGEVTRDELFRSLDMVKEDILRGQIIEASLYDFTDITAFSANVKDIMLYSKRCTEMAQLNPNVKMAVIAPKDIAFGMARMWECYVDGVGYVTKVFRFREDAQTWLNF